MYLLRECKQPLSQLPLDELPGVDLQGEGLGLSPLCPLRGDLAALAAVAAAAGADGGAARGHTLALIAEELVQGTDVA